jgi:CubicO group peptidase (beta-lactamase class C family)
MYVLAAHLITKYSGIPFTSFVSDRIFLPLRMNSTTYRPSLASTSGNFTQSWTAFGRRIPNWFDDAVVENLLAGPAGIISSARDMVQWMKLLLNDNSKSATGIPRTVLDEVMVPISLMPQEEKIEGMGMMTYGMGWEQTTYKGHSASQHVNFFNILDD